MLLKYLHVIVRIVATEVVVKHLTRDETFHVFPINFCAKENACPISDPNSSIIKFNVHGFLRGEMKVPNVEIERPARLFAQVRSNVVLERDYHPPRNSLSISCL